MYLILYEREECDLDPPNPVVYWREEFITYPETEHPLALNKVAQLQHSRSHRNVRLFSLFLFLGTEIATLD